jgi:two-component system sensor histidine kinase BarA
MMRLPRISLAVKYRILFGTAVVLILGAALYVPWYLMEDLVLEQPAFREAQRIADDYFRLAMATPSSGGTGGGLIHSKEFSLLSEGSPVQPQFVQLTTNVEDADSVLNQPGTDPFVGQALRSFLAHPKREHAYTTRVDGESRRFLYAHAVRVKQSCLACHGKGSARPYVENQLAGVISVNLPIDRSAADLIWNRIWLIASGALAGILAILVFYVITTKFILSPIHDLRRVAIHVADGNLDERSTVRTGDEFEQLSDNLNNMLERLRTSQDELKHANKLLDEKLGEMAETNVALYEANRLKSEFLANVSHELRTPLTSIIGFAELLREGAENEPDSRTARYLENILISGRILLEIINDLLDLAKIEAGRSELRLESVHIAQICTTLVDFMRPQADARRLKLTLEADDGLPIMITDRGKVRQILFNLLSNAVKFTPPEGAVTLRVARDGSDGVRLSIADTGPGIAEEDQPIVFEKFRQVDQSATRQHEGTGLGLAIARELTRLLGGDIGVESRPGAGSTFWVRLPVVTPEPTERTPIPLV